MAEIRQVGVVGLGAMGAGIAEVFARSGVSVVGVELNEEALSRGEGHLRRSTDRAVSRGRLSEEDQATLLGRVQFATGMAALADVDLVIEAVPERMDIKHSIFSALAEACRPDAILASNTSSLSITEIAAGTPGPERVIGVHFFNPAPVMKLVEVIHSVSTSPEVIEAMTGLVTRIGKTPVSVGDRPGFVANYLLLGYMNHAATLLSEGRATREDIDTAMRLGAGLPMGPLTLLDLIGLDVCYDILQIMYAQTGLRRHLAAPLLRQLVTAGRLGRKTGHGFYAYDKPNSGTVTDPAPAPAGTARPVTTVAGTGALAELLQAAGLAKGDSADAQLILVDAADPDSARAAFADLTVAPGTVLAATSDVPVRVGAVSNRHPEDVIGLRLVGDKLVELTTTALTSADTEATARAVLAQAELGVARSGDRAGGLVDTLLLPYLNDAIGMLAEGYASADEIDAAMTLGCGYPIGPIALADQRGLDEVLRGLRSLYAEAPDPTFAPSMHLVELVELGRRGGAISAGLRG